MGLLAPLRRRPQQNPQVEGGSQLPPLPHRQAHPRLRLGSPLPGQSHPRAPARRPRPRLRLLGILRLRAGHPQSRCRRLRNPLPRSRRRCRPLLFLLRRHLRRGLRHRNPRPLHSPFPHPSQVARRKALLGIRLHRPAHLRPHGHLPGLLLRRGHRHRSATSMVGPHSVAAHLFAHHPPHQAPASAAQPLHRLSFPRQLQSNPAPQWRRRLRPDRRRRSHANRQPPGLLLRRVRPLHRALPCRQHRQAPQPQRNHPRRPRLPQRPRPRLRPAPARQIQLPASRLPVHDLRRVRVPMPGRHRAPSDSRRPPPRRGQHRRMGRQLRRKALPQSRARLELTRPQPRRARQVH